MGLISRLAINPLRIAFDHADDISVKNYVDAVLLAAKYKIKTLSNYILFNFEDEPKDFYKRLEINVDLNERFEKENLPTRIWSFPMKYSPVNGERCKDRKHVGTYWNAKLLRGIQCVLNATHGVVGPKKAFFQKAFGKDVNEFLEILYMPEDYIINRDINVNNGNASNWKVQYYQLGDYKSEFIELIKDNNFKNIKIISNDVINKIMTHYIP